MATSIKVEDLSKIYRLGEIGTGTISRDLERFIKMKDDDRVMMGKKAQVKALSLFGLDQISIQFDQLISLIK
jgi:hypothetical protein